VAVTCGLQKVVVPFFDRGLSIEYELVRSICTVTQQKRKKIGVLTTDAKLFGGFDIQTFSQTAKQPLVEEIAKQYEVVQVNTTMPIEEDIDAILAVQPSTLGPDQMPHFVEAVRRGVPTAIFEDPLPIWIDAPGTGQPRRSPQQNPMMGMMGQQAPPKGRIEDLWRLLHVQFSPNDVVWQDYNPYPKLPTNLPKEFVFVDTAAERPVFGADPISAKLQQVLFAFPGSVTKRDDKLRFEELVQTGKTGGTIKFDEILTPGMFGRGQQINEQRRFKRPATPTNYNLAVRIRGKSAPDKAMSDEAAEPAGGLDDEPSEGEGDGTARSDEASDDESSSVKSASGNDADEITVPDESPKPEPKKPRDIDVVLVTDIDLFSTQIFQLRAQGSELEGDVALNFDNVTFVLNLLDSLAGDTRFLEIRNRRPRHRTLTTIENRAKEARDDRQKELESFRDAFSRQRDEEQAALDKKVAAIRKLDIDEVEKQQRIQIEEELGNKRLQQLLDRSQKDIARKIQEIERDLAADVGRVQDGYKMWAVFLPPVFPLSVGLFVFFGRRSREREGVARSRLR
jgi:ABC-2 type transport system permease protein